MNAPKHSPEPWRYEPRLAEGVIVASDSTIVGETGSFVGDDIRRIVACVNAFEDIPTEAVEALSTSVSEFLRLARPDLFNGTVIP